MSRIDKKHYYRKIAELAAERGTCDRAKVGAVLVKDGRIIATGFNGSPAGMPHCDDVGHLMSKNKKHCLRTVHAEANCIIQAAKLGISCQGSVIYITHKPCHNCCKMLINAGVLKAYYISDYDDGINDQYKDKLELVKID